MERIRDVLKPNGKIVLTTPNWGHIYTYNQWKEIPTEVDEMTYDKLTQCGHVYQYNKAEMLEIIEASRLNFLQYDLSDANNHNFLLELK